MLEIKKPEVPERRINYKKPVLQQRSDKAYICTEGLILHKGRQVQISHPIIDDLPDQSSYIVLVYAYEMTHPQKADKDGSA